jgi:uncharacterized phage protein (TIGR01671 family)
MRTIKFRAWDKELKQFDNIVAGNLLYSLHDEGLTQEDKYRFVLQEYTGLNDTKGREIFEGDIVTLKTVARDHLTQVIFIQGCFAFKVINPQGTLSLVFAHSVEDRFFEPEVVGNIFENPDLLP